MPTSKQSHPPVTKSAICPNCGIAQVMYDARLVDSFKEEDRKFDRRPQTNHHDHQNFLIIITFSLSQPLFEANMNIIITNLTSSLSQLFGTTLQPFVAPNLLTTWTNAPQIEIRPIFGDRGDKTATFSRWPGHTSSKSIVNIEWLCATGHEENIYWKEDNKWFNKRISISCDVRGSLFCGFVPWNWTCIVTAGKCIKVSICIRAM